MLFCGSFVLGAEAPVALMAEQSKVYQGLVAKFQANQLTADDNTYANIGILTQQEAFLSQAVKVQATKKQLLWPYWLAASFGPAVSMLNYIGEALDLLNSGRPIYDQYNVGWLSEPAMWPYDINASLGLPGGMVSTLVYQIAPVIAFYGIYKMYSSLKNQQQELETVRSILATLKIFGQPGQ